MQTVVLAAGAGTRMRPLTDSIPKPMLPVAGQPLVAHTIERAVAAGASRIILVIGYESDQVRTYFGNSYDGVPIEYTVQPEQRGTADAVRVASQALADEPFVVLNGDALYDIPALQKLYQNGPAVGSYRVSNPSSYGVLQTDGNRVTGVVEKPIDPPSNLINTGAYVFPAETRDRLDVGVSERGELELTDVLQAVCDAHTVTAVPFERWLDVGRPWELLSANEWLSESLVSEQAGTVHSDATISGSVVVADGATIKSGVTIEGPAYIGSGATIGPNAYIRGSTYICSNAKVGHAVEVKNSILFEGATVGHLSYIGDSLIGKQTNFGAGTTVGNLRHDGEPIKLTVKGKRVSTGRRKMGVVCGDEVKTGINTSLNPGVILSSESFTTPGEVVTHDR
ncbi:bifunctional sugar-1-phosphate nucleotidylyltransferase/acetyltransferase [Natronocalculus amylovorans]|uniref:Bifunctional protein GlmU n=1 Tax=Natronocalculus amylovorans TaxID=2917812 RepID=A0AAE3K8N5_9EURY|nr:bifunctional sugar-1-phosphate nucleotidylyltransferase/acetyltransferase [Natronocalculus amylovorans]MCL9817226.1 NTP transferase domain-containing protein [Natronocalculus amylovorans]